MKNAILMMVRLLARLAVLAENLLLKQQLPARTWRIAI
jgi:hypothetical protein